MSRSDAGKATVGSLAFLFMTIGAFVALLSFAGNAGAVVRSGGTGTDPWISSELPDYAPGSTVNLLGGSWQPGEAVHIHVNDSAGQTWVRDVEITANSTGDIGDTFTLPDWFVANYSVTATGASGSFATSTFTDSQPQAVTVAAPTSVSVTAGNTANFGTVSVQVNGNSSNCTITLSAVAVAGDTGLPTGATPSLTNNPNTTNANYTSSLSVSSAASVLAGTYTFHVTATRAADCQGNGVVTSTQQLILTVTSSCTAPSVTTQPSDQSIIYGANASFTAGASGSPAPTVQWQVNNGSGFTGIGGATSSTLSLSKPLVSASGNHYRAVFSNSCGSVNSDAATLTVAAKNLTVTGITAFDKVYDGTTSATIDTSSAGLNGVVSGDAVTLGTGGASGAFLSKTVGTAKTVQISGLTISGTDAGNYSLTQPTTTADITAKELNVSFQANNKVYDRTTGATIKSGPAPSMVGVVSGDVVTLDGSLATASFGTKDVGAGKTVTAGDFTKGGADAGNYVFASPQGTTTADITARDLTVTANGVDKVYDGTRDATVTLTSDALSGDDVTVDYDSAAFADKHVGTGKPVSVSGISSSGADSGNYNLLNTTATSSADISARPITVSAVGDSKVYDATTSSDETPTISSGSIAGGDSANFSQDYETRDVGTGKTLVPSGSVSDGNAGDNYAVTFVNDTTGVITAKPLSGSFTADNKVYDGNRAATVATKSLPGVIGGDAVMLDVSNTLFDTKNVGTDKDVTGDLSLSGLDAGNYSVNAQYTAKADITPLGISGSFESADKVYDGTTSAAASNRQLSEVMGLDDVHLSGGTAGFADKNVGTDKPVTLTGASLSGIDAGNYSLTSVPDAHADITPRNLTITATGDSKVYDGTTVATVGLNSDRVVGDEVFLNYASASFDTKNVGPNKPVSVSGITISGADATNYDQLNATASTNADITRKLVVGNFTAADKVWDGTTSATVLSRSLATPITGDDVSLGGGTATFNNANVGASKPVTLTGATLTGADAGNYSLDDVNTAVARITAWNAAGRGFYAPVGVANSIFSAAPVSAPVTNVSGLWNSAKGGSTIPLKFNVFAGTVEKTSLGDIASFQSSKLASCAGGSMEDPVDTVASTGGTSLRYDTTGMQWIQNWKTPNVSSDACYRAWVTFADGSTIEGFFKLKK